MLVAYRLRDDARHVENVQKATLSTGEYGIEPTHGLFGSDEWWSRIQRGDLPTSRVRGTIRQTYMAGMNDWPEFELLSDEGEISRWTREANSKVQEQLYEPGRRIEIDYVVQRLRPGPWGGGNDTKVVLEIRIGDTGP